MNKKKNIFSSEFEPELSPKWKALSEILRLEIPNDIKRSIDRRPNILNEPIKVLILCQDSRTCSQLNQYLLQGGERHLFYQAVRNDLDVSKLADTFQVVKESDADAVRIENAAVYKTKVIVVKKRVCVEFCSSFDEF